MWSWHSCGLMHGLFIFHIYDLGRNARFAQIWRSRKGEKNEADESLREICHLYDAVQVDPDEEKHPAEPE
jgi:hypothetical protein